ncbi:hypothetical protein Ga0123461_1099 [Mariprofundus aestuarium]|uniref:DUF4911 domain-containing protein n=1 Tax=Mariprofundus aestuarium TaxID=1921086 RepID=A0A2K8KX88_MARES|nr:DUF4911 domain-containing protein [Mariprofundus aestuarium]ATX79518.1 hypothetical protein Ga0123461_1099 [Mariprofundus aestuarium]
MVNEPTLVVEIELPVKLSFRFQMLLEGEDGLAVVRCYDPEHKKQQLWTTPCQRTDLLDWLTTLPEALEVKVQAEWIWGDEIASRKSLLG